MLCCFPSSKLHAGVCHSKRMCWRLLLYLHDAAATGWGGKGCAAGASGRRNTDDPPAPAVEWLAAWWPVNGVSAARQLDSTQASVRRGPARAAAQRLSRSGRTAAAHDADHPSAGVLYGSAALSGRDAVLWLAPCYRRKLTVCKWHRTPLCITSIYRCWRHMAMYAPAPTQRGYWYQHMFAVIAPQKLSAAAQASLRALTNLRHLEAKLLLTPDLLMTLQPLHALMQLRLVMCLRWQHWQKINDIAMIQPCVKGLLIAAVYPEGNVARNSAADI